MLKELPSLTRVFLVLAVLQYHNKARILSTNEEKVADNYVS